MRTIVGSVVSVGGQARFSPGPWWGFNGVDRLELTADGLTVHHFRFTHRVPTVYEMSSIAVISSKIRADKRTGRAKWMRMTLRLNASTRTFTGHAEDGEPFLAALMHAVDEQAGGQATTPSAR